MEYILYTVFITIILVIMGKSYQKKEKPFKKAFKKVSKGFDYTVLTTEGLFRSMKYFVRQNGYCGFKYIDIKPGTKEYAWNNKEGYHTRREDDPEEKEDVFHNVFFIPLVFIFKHSIFIVHVVDGGGTLRYFDNNLRLTTAKGKHLAFTGDFSADANMDLNLFKSYAKSLKFNEDKIVEVFYAPNKITDLSKIAKDYNCKVITASKAKELAKKMLKTDSEYSEYLSKDQVVAMLNNFSDKHVLADVSKGDYIQELKDSGRWIENPEEKKEKNMFKKKKNDINTNLVNETKEIKNTKKDNKESYDDLIEYYKELNPNKDEATILSAIERSPYLKIKLSDEEKKIALNNDIINGYFVNTDGARLAAHERYTANEDKKTWKPYTGLNYEPFIKLWEIRKELKEYEEKKEQFSGINFNFSERKIIDSKIEELKKEEEPIEKEAPVIENRENHKMLDDMSEFEFEFYQKYIFDNEISKQRTLERHFLAEEIKEMPEDAKNYLAYKFGEMDNKYFYNEVLGKRIMYSHIPNKRYYYNRTNLFGDKKPFYYIGSRFGELSGYCDRVEVSESGIKKHYLTVNDIVVNAYEYDLQKKIFAYGRGEEYAPIVKDVIRDDVLRFELRTLKEEYDEKALKYAEERWKDLGYHLDIEKLPSDIYEKCKEKLTEELKYIIKREYTQKRKDKEWLIEVDGYYIDTDYDSIIKKSLDNAISALKELIALDCAHPDYLRPHIDDDLFEEVSEEERRIRAAKREKESLERWLERYE